MPDRARAFGGAKREGTGFVPDRCGWAVGWALVAAAAAGGCGDARIPTYPVHGTVLLKDGNKPLSDGVMIWFESTKAPYPRSMAVIESDGKFVLSFDREANGAPEGEHRVRISPQTADGRSIANVIEKLIDPKYFEYSTSGLTATIQKAGENNFEFVLDPPGGKK